MDLSISLKSQIFLSVTPILIERKNLLSLRYIAKKAWLYGRSLYYLSSDDIILAFYPKTGSTWVRFFLYNLLKDAPLEEPPPSFDELNTYMAEFGHSSMSDPWPFESQPRLIKTHRPYNWLFRGNRSMLVVRDPRDIMVSFYHYATAKETNSFDGTLEDMIWHSELGLEAFFQHYASWKEHVGLIVRYEDLKTTPSEHFKRIAEFCQVEAEDDQIRRAIKRSSLENVRQSQERSGNAFDHLDDDFTFARKGTPSQWQDHFGEAALAEYDRLCREYDFHLYE